MSEFIKVLKVLGFVFLIGLGVVVTGIFSTAGIGAGLFGMVGIVDFLEAVLGKSLFFTIAATGGAGAFLLWVWKDPTGTNKKVTTVVTLVLYFGLMWGNYH